MFKDFVHYFEDRNFQTSSSDQVWNDDKHGRIRYITEIIDTTKLIQKHIIQAVYYTMDDVDQNNDIQLQTTYYLHRSQIVMQSLNV